MQFQVSKVLTVFLKNKISVEIILEVDLWVMMEGGGEKGCLRRNVFKSFLTALIANRFQSS